MRPRSADHFFDGGGHEQTAGYARAVRSGDTILVSGTTANDGQGGALHIGDTGAQTAAALRQALAAIEGLGGCVDDVVRTRVFLTPQADWRAASAAHAAVLGDRCPANTMVVVHGLIGDDFLVEVEVDAIVEPTRGP
jgi:enamine deaminase RidA (YjgF/YER057c/UK114 family)